MRIDARVILRDRVICRVYILPGSGAAGVPFVVEVAMTAME